MKVLKLSSFLHSDTTYRNKASTQHVLLISSQLYMDWIYFSILLTAAQSLLFKGHFPDVSSYYPVFGIVHHSASLKNVPSSSPTILLLPDSRLALWLPHDLNVGHQTDFMFFPWKMPFTGPWLWSLNQITLQLHTSELHTSVSIYHARHLTYAF